jgi:transposase
MVRSTSSKSGTGPGVRAHPGAADPRVNALLARKPLPLVTAAMGNRAARAIWAIMVRGEIYRAPAHGPAAA